MRTSSFTIWIFSLLHKIYRTLKAPNFGNKMIFLLTSKREISFFLSFVTEEHFLRSQRSSSIIEQHCIGLKSGQEARQRPIFFVEQQAVTNCLFCQAWPNGRTSRIQNLSRLQTRQKEQQLKFTSSSSCDYISFLIQATPRQ